MQDRVGTAHGADLVFAVWRRRKWLSVLVFAALFSATAVVVRSLPDVYEAHASVLVEQQQPQERLVGPGAGGEVETRLRTISQEILSRSRLNELIVRFGLYSELKEQAPPEALADRMRRDIRLEFTEVPQPWAGRQATIAYTISYRGQDPDTVPRVANALAALFIERNASIRERQTTGTVDLLRAQLEEVKQKLAEQERRISEFKVRHSGELPEHQGANLEASKRLSEQLRLNIDMQLRLLEQRETLTRPVPVSSSPAAAPDEISAQLSRLRQELAALRTRFTDEHPDVVRVKAQIAALEVQRADAPSPTQARQVGERQSNEPLRKVEAELAALKAEERSIRRAMASYERRVENAPRREQELQQISRDYGATKDLYQSLLQRHEDAQLAERMSQGQYGEQFRVLDPAVPPHLPVAPNRFRLLLVGVMLAAAAAIGAAVIAETLDSSFHSLDDLRAFTEVPVLASVSPIVTSGDAARRSWRFAFVTIAAVIGIAAVAGAAFYLARGNGMLVQILTLGGSF